MLKMENPNWMRCLIVTATEEQFRATALSTRWLSLKYLFFMETFNLEEFQENVPFSYLAVKIIPYLNLTRPCHRQAFVHLVRNEQADFTNSEGLSNNMLDQCVFRQDTDYLRLFLQHSRTMPPVHSNGNFFISRHIYDSKEKLELLAPRLNLESILTFGPNTDWKF